MFDGSARAAIGQIAKRIGVEPAALLAVAEIESAGRPFAMVDGRPMPLIRWECHYFHRLLPNELKPEGVAARLAHPRAGAIPNPNSQAARYQMLKRGMAIHEEAAIGSCSWGLGQVMGSHWRSLGYSSAQHLMKTACSGIPGQTELMARFIQKNGLTNNLRQKNWKAFARAYNGPAYRQNRYDEKMARAYIRYLNGRPPPGLLAPIITEYAPPALEVMAEKEEDEFALKPGSSGPAVKDLQQALKRAGFFVYPDGHYGPATKKAVMEFQRRAGLEPTGRVGSETRAKLVKLQLDSVAPWWSSSMAGETATLPTQRPQPKRNWWETGGEQAAVQPQHGRKAWWDV
jgi:hypothetical protein